MVGFWYHGRKEQTERPHREWVDDDVGCLQEVSHSAQERLKWRQIYSFFEEASDSKGR